MSFKIIHAKSKKKITGRIYEPACNMAMLLSASLAGEEYEEVFENAYKDVFRDIVISEEKEAYVSLISFEREISLRMAINAHNEIIGDGAVQIIFVSYEDRHTIPSYTEYKLSQREFACEIATPMPRRPLGKRSAFAAVEREMGKAAFACGDVCQSVMPDMDMLDDEHVLSTQRELGERMKHRADSFSQYLLYLIERKGMKNADVYRRAIVDKKVFSKIKNDPEYHPTKLTALCLCIGACLNLDETRDLLMRAGYALSPSDPTDIIFRYYIENEFYDMIEIDIQLENYGLPCIIA